MIRLNKITDYAIVTLARMAKTSKVMAVAELSQTTGIPAPTVAKLLKKLTRANLVQATRGAAGGYQIARAAEDISVVAIIEAMDGPFAMTDCVHGSTKGPCGFEGRCEARHDLNRINHVVRDALEKMSLADMGSR